MTQPLQRIAVFSGKGGTGKTTITASFASLQPQLVAVDCDVDAANLALLLTGEDGPEHDFFSGTKATIDPAACAACGSCAEVCRFDAIHPVSDSGSHRFRPDYYSVQELSCEGCHACALVCPADAISFHDNRAGSWRVRKLGAEDRWLVHAELGVAQDNSGKLVARIREEADSMAIERGIPLVLIDGPPGLGCPVHAALTGIQRMLVIAEPTPSGEHDLVRLLDLAKHFDVRADVVINKADLSEKGAAAVEARCAEYDVPVIGRIPFDRNVPRLMAQGKTPVDEDGPVADAIRAIWATVSQSLNPG